MKIDKKELSEVMFALTLKDRAERRDRWIARGFRLLNTRPETLFNYWEKRLGKGNLDDLSLYTSVVAEYKEHLKNPLGKQSKKSFGVNTPKTPASYSTTTQSTPKIPVSYPNTSHMLSSFSKSMTNWAKKGFKVVTPEQFEARLNECRTCEFWDPEALAGTGRCKLCGCSTQAKLRLATEKCPIDKWGPVTDLNNAYEQPNEQPNSNPEPNPTAA